MAVVDGNYKSLKYEDKTTKETRQIEYENGYKYSVGKESFMWNGHYSIRITRVVDNVSTSSSIVIPFELAYEIFSVLLDDAKKYEEWKKGIDKMSLTEKVLSLSDVTPNNE